MWPFDGYHKSCLQCLLRDIKSWLIAMFNSICSDITHLNNLLAREKVARGKPLHLSTLLHTTSGHGPTTGLKLSSVRAGEKLDCKGSVHNETLVFQGLSSTAVSIKYSVLKNTILLINKYLDRHFYEIVKLWGYEQIDYQPTVLNCARWELTKLNVASYTYLKLLHIRFSKAYIKLEC
jgi:hypothetical protein